MEGLNRVNTKFRDTKFCIAKFRIHSNKIQSKIICKITKPVLILNILPSSKSNVPEPELDCGVVAVAPKATAYSKCLKKKNNYYMQ
jgi:hypothetical protein